MSVVTIVGIVAIDVVEIAIVLDVAIVFIIFGGDRGRYLHGPMWGVTGGSIIA